MAEILIASTGNTLIQDAGRFGYTNVGVPTSGPFHPLNYTLAAKLIDEETPAVFEILNGSFTIRSIHDVAVSVTGEAEVLLGMTSIASNMCVLLPAGTPFEVKPLTTSPAYVAIAGYTPETILNSASTDTFSYIKSVNLTAGEYLTVADATNKTYTLVGRFVRMTPHLKEETIRYIPGPHILQPLKGEYQVSGVSRVGVKLNCIDEENRISGGGSLASVPVYHGVIQMPTDGNPIILGPDCGVTGGYPVAGKIIYADLHKIAELTESEKIIFKPVTVEEATDAYNKMQQTLKSAVIDLSTLF